MGSLFRGTPGSHDSDLIAAIGQVRRRWRLKLALRGVVLVVALAVGALVGAAVGLESWRFSPGSILTFRVLLAVVVAATVGLLFVRPLMRRVRDEQVALYLEEHEPSLQAEIISAVEADAASRLPGAQPSALVDRLVASAVEKVRSIEYGRRVERMPIRRYSGAFAVIAVAAIAIFTLGPAFLRHAVSALLVVSRSVEAAVPYRIEVTPGNATIPRGADQTITASLMGFDADQAALMVRRAADAPFERMPLVRAENRYEGMLFDLATPLDYYVEANGVRSATYTLKVVDLPYVQRVELEYHFPAYTGLAPRKIEDGGDIAVLAGTEVRVRIVPTMTAKGGQIVLHDKASTGLTVAADGSLSTSFKADRDGFYRVELDAPTGERVPASPQYTIDVLTDQAPIVSISKPGRDTSASPIEEVFVEASAEDDFGVRDLELVYSVNGAPEKTIRLFDGKSRLAEVSAGHTFYLEELGVQPGDFVSYFARAADNDGVAGPKRASSDLYFVQVRPLRKEFRRAESQAGGGGGGGGGGEVGALSQQQRQIISATFNVQRDRKTMTAEKLKENSIVVALAQARLREQVEGLLTRMNSRLVEQDPAFKKIAELLPQAVTQMTAAEAKLRAPDPQAALEPEQKALQYLQKAEEEDEVQVSMQRGGAGGGGGQSSMAQDLADIFELELDRMANQYETTQRASQQNADQKLDELMEKLKELARRQEQEAEAQRRRAALGQQGGGSSGNQQRTLAEQAEEAARRLEQLSREENRPELAQTARQLRDAADAMRRASATGDPSAAAQASAALERLKEAERRLQQSQSGRAERDVRNALKQAEELAQEQREIAESVNNALGESGENRQDKVSQLSQRKEQFQSKVGQFEQQLNRSSADIAKTERDASRKMAEAAGTMRDSSVRDRIGYTRSMLRDARTRAEDMQAMENTIGSTLDAVRDKLREAASALGRSRPDAMTEALNRARDLARGMESMDQRMRERAQQGRQAQQGQRGQQGQAGRGQRAQQGEQGQSGQQGQQGSQGQQGQEGSQGQQGQQGGQGGRNDGQRTQDGRGGDGDTFGPWRNDGGGFGDRRPGRFGPDDIRQFRGEYRQWANQAEQLRRLLQGQSERLDTRQLDEILKGLRALQDDRVYQDVEELARLQTAVSENMKRFEFSLRRRAESAAGQPVLSGSDEVPEPFRKLVEQYYKSLSKGSERKQ